MARIVGNDAVAWIASGTVGFASLCSTPWIETTLRRTSIGSVSLGIASSAIVAARVRRGGEGRGEELLRDARAREHHRGPEVDVGRVGPLGVRLVEDLESDLLGPGRGAVQVRSGGLRHLAEDLGARVVRAIDAVA